MIFVYRKRPLEPEILRSGAAKAAREAAQDFFKRPRSSRLQERFAFNSEIWVRCRDELRTLFNMKCAFCESPLVAPSDGKVSHFRPSVEATGRLHRGTEYSDSDSFPQAESDPDAYWWLAYEWENLYFSCITCDNNKKNQFPVIGSRATAGMKGADLQRERALLVDPCQDHPEQFLDFQESGIVKAQFPSDPKLGKGFEGFDRGATTIDVFGLNREDLVGSRRRAAGELVERLGTIARHAIFGSESKRGLLELIDPTKPFAGLRRQLVREMSAKLYDRIPAETRSRFEETLEDVAPELAPLRKGGEALAMAPSARVSPQKKALRRRPSILPTSSVESIEIRNFKAIRHLKLSIPPSTGGRAGWKVLLGENGCGKSSILQAISLALCGRDLRERDNQLLTPKQCLRKLPGKDRSVSKGFIRIHLSGGPSAFELHFDRKNFSFGKSLEPIPRVPFLRAYGATRLLPRQRSPVVKATLKRESIKVENLFNPFEPILDADAWLTRLKRNHFGSAALALKDLLGLPPRLNLTRKHGKVRVPVGGLKHPLDELSAGYESVLAMATDIMAGVMGTVHDLRHATGVVLLDEIDAHLHPRWKMQIVEKLRRTFSSMQFVVTTHEPLCLRGLEKGEVLVLERFGKEITVLDDLPSPKSMRVDQLLMSNLFGLHSTIDPEMDTKFSRYYELLARQQADLKPEEAQERETLRNELSKYENRLMASGPREELLYEAIDEFLAKELWWRGEDRKKLPQLREETKQRVADLWKQINSAPEAAR